MAGQDILINWAPQETRVAIVENGVVQELHVERALERGLVGNVYLGKVARVLPGMQSAFVEIGLERAAFLHIADIWEHRQNGHAGERPIERILSHIGEPAEPPRISPARGPPAWDDPPIEAVPDWDARAQPQPEYVFDHQVQW